MSEEERLEERLDAWAAAPEDAGDWKDVLRRAGERPSARRLPRRRLVLALAATVAVAVSLGAVFMSHGTHGSSPEAKGPGPIGPAGPMGPGNAPTLAHPLPAGAQQVSLSDAQSAFGGHIVLPDTLQSGLSDVGAVWITRDLGPTLGRGLRGAAVTFPAAGVWVNYEEGLNVYADDVLLSWQAMARQTPADFRVIDLNGVPALASSGSVEFIVEGVEVTVLGHADQTTLRVIAQSIVDRAEAPPDGQLGRVNGIQLFPYFPPARQIDVADASSTLGAPVVLPDTSLAKPSDVGQVWAERSCPEPDGQVTDLNLLHACWIWVSFPSAGLSVGYLRPPMYNGTENEWKLQARMYGDNAAAIQLGNVPALAIEPRDPYPGSVEFDLDGTRVVVAGGYDVAALQTVAQSIVDRAAG